MTAVGKKT